MKKEEKKEWPSYVWGIIGAVIGIIISFLIHFALLLRINQFRHSIIFYILFTGLVTMLSYRLKHKFVLPSAPLIIAITCVAFLSFGTAFEKMMMESSKPQVFYKKEAVESIKAVFNISDNVKNSYFYMDGFQDHTIFIAFSDDRERIDEIVKEKTGKELEELEPWDKQIGVHDFNYRPGAYDAIYRNKLYNPDNVKNGLFYQKREQWSGWHIIYDLEESKLYYCWWNM